MPPPRVHGASRSRASQVPDTPYPPTVPRGGSQERVFGQIRARLQVIASRPPTVTRVHLPDNQVAIATTTYTLREAASDPQNPSRRLPPRLVANVVVEYPPGIRREQTAQWDSQVRSQASGQARRELHDAGFAPEYFSSVSLRNSFT